MPCNAKLDVKATDDGLAAALALIPFFPSPKAKAKVEIHDDQSSREFLLWAVPEIDPKTVAALFVDEDPKTGVPAVPSEGPHRTTGLTRPEMTTHDGEEWQRQACKTSR